MGRTARVGLLDLDIFGPSVPKLMGLEGHEPEMTKGEFAFPQDPKLLSSHSDHDSGYHDRMLIGVENRLIPLQNHGVQTMSIGYLLRTPTSHLHIQHGGWIRLTISAQSRERYAGSMARDDGDEGRSTSQSQSHFLEGEGEADYES